MSCRFSLSKFVPNRLYTSCACSSKPNIDLLPAPVGASHAN
jgi:hypothetical protein